MYIYVLDKNGKPLMPTRRAGRVRRMLRDGRAVIASHTPFTVRLTYDTPHYIQRVTLGVDAGTAHVGLSASTVTRELYAAEAERRTDIVENLSTRRGARRTRRSRRSVRYRAPRFDNRRKPEGWLAPSVLQKVASHVRLIEDVTKILPVTDIVIEVAPFDERTLTLSLDLYGGIPVPAPMSGSSGFLPTIDEWYGVEIELLMNPNPK